MAVDLELLSSLLENLKLDHDTKSFRDIVNTLLTIYRNILHEEENLKYRVIKPENPTFSKKIWSEYSCRQFMLLSGWIEVHGKLVFNSDENLIDVIQTLVKYRDVAPHVEEWDESTKHEGPSEEQLREEQLRQKAAIERQKELDEFMKDKKYREKLNTEVKAKIHEDRQKQKVFKEPVVGNKLKKGAKIKTLPQ